MPSKKNLRVLFISHDATRTGAPIIFHTLIKWISKNSKISFEIVLKNGGELESDFSQLGPTWLIDNQAPAKRTFLERIRGPARHNGDRRRLTASALLDRLATEFRPDVIYSNTATNGEILEKLSVLGSPIITHVHELDFWIREKVGAASFELVERNTEAFVSVSEAVSTNLTKNWGVDPSRIKLIHGFIETPPADSGVPKKTQKDIRAEIGIPEGCFVVGGSGTLDWRKAPEYFIHLAFAVRKHRPQLPIHFVWIGGSKEGSEFAELQHELRLTNLHWCVHFLGAKVNARDYFSVFDLFAMVSREDPFPLVNLEAASLGKPVVCFDSPGGSREFVESDCGSVISYLDFDAMAGAICALLADPVQLRSYGDRAREKVIERHRVETQGPKVLELIEGLCKS